MKHQPTLRFSLRCEAGRRFCFRDITQHTLSVRSFVPHSHINSFRADNSPCRDPSARNLCQTMCRCVLSRCFTVTLRAFRTSRSSGHWRPVRHAPRQFAGILHANSAAPPHMQPGEVARFARQVENGVPFLSPRAAPWPDRHGLQVRLFLRLRFSPSPSWRQPQTSPPARGAL